MTSRISGAGLVLDDQDARLAAVDAVVLVETGDAEQLGELRNRLAALPGVASVTTATVLKTVVERP